MAVVELLERGRESFARREWASAYAHLAAVAQDAPIGAEDLYRLATSALLVGHDEEGCDLLARAYPVFLDDDDTLGAVRCAFMAGMVLNNRGQHAQSAGWVARVRRLVEEGRVGEVERAYLLVPPALAAVRAGDGATALEGFSAALAVAERHREADLVALAKLGVGTSRVVAGEVEEGFAVLDEVMVDVTSGAVSGLPAGIVYCAVIDTCHAIFDLGRAREWTDALTRWCQSQPDLVPFRGECLVHRSELLVYRGDWAAALTEADRAVERLAQPPGQPVLGMALYQRAQILRLRGDLAEAEAAYREAAAYGHAQPGMALLRLAQGRPDQAAASIRRACAEIRDEVARCRLLPAYVEVMLAVGDVTAARAGAEELTTAARTHGAQLLAAVAAHARGAVRLAEGDATGALAALREACAAWQELDAPYEAARTRVLLARACRLLGDADGAQLERGAAAATFAELGALPELAALESPEGAAGPARSPGRAAAPGGLTAREVEVLRLVATGRTNRAIAADLVLSEKTVARHLSNIFTKLDLASRAAATAYAYEHHLV
ncbi:LuxR family transcriptional regulator [Georgenia sp. SYP-B2076]|uniref:LuxR family transcriptional regulator n=1 Tax=Georgenia sp. SYP-B2076 TaxID=2495881 RepID=UPI000F8C7F2A|nr:LuxR family transcriptional regulator [Georgenia sp. SYP-B2076]